MRTAAQARDQLMNGRRVRELSNAIHDGDAVPLRQLRETVADAAGVTSIGETGDPISGAVLLAEGVGIEITRSGQTWTFTATGEAIPVHIIDGGFFGDPVDATYDAGFF